MKLFLIVITTLALFFGAFSFSSMGAESPPDAVKTYYDNGQVMTSEPASGDGARITYYRDGRMQSKTRMIQGKRQGQFFGYYPGGALKAQGQYADDHKEGIFRRFYEDGGLMFETEYKDGHMISPLKGYDEEGKQITEIEPTDEFELAGGGGALRNALAVAPLMPSVTDDESYEYTKEFYQDGSLRAEKFYKNNLLEGVIKEYHKNGQIKYHDVYKQGKLIYRREYDELGTPLSRSKKPN